jgi:hypothetical protein
MKGNGDKIMMGLDDCDRDCFGEWLVRLKQNKCIPLRNNYCSIVHVSLDLHLRGEYKYRRMVSAEAR